MGVKDDSDNGGRSTAAEAVLHRRWRQDEGEGGGAEMDPKCRSARVVGLNQVSPRVPAGNYPVSHVPYELNVLGARGPRRMSCIMDSIPASAVQEGGKAPTQTEFPLSGLDSFPSISFFRSKSPRIEIVQLYNYLLRRKKSWFRRINLLGGMSNCNDGASTSVDGHGLLLPL
uniref:Tubby C-terminal domain-containing protein n=2 Tax=Oryza TaxID=4527 RepID=A0A0D3FIF9_9ORYZ